MEDSKNRLREGLCAVIFFGASCQWQIPWTNLYPRYLVLRIRHQGDSFVGEAGMACHRGARGTSHMIFAQLARKE
jgi:hypothetical protein